MSTGVDAKLATLKSDLAPGTLNFQFLGFQSALSSSLPRFPSVSLSVSDNNYAVWSLRYAVEGGHLNETVTLTGLEYNISQVNMLKHSAVNDAHVLSRSRPSSMHTMIVPN